MGISLISICTEQWLENCMDICNEKYLEPLKMLLPHESIQKLNEAVINMGKFYFESCASDCLNSYMDICVKPLLH